MSEDGQFLVMVGVIVAILVGAFLIFNAQSDACADKGGHMHTIYKSQICISEDGRILE